VPNKVMNVFMSEYYKRAISMFQPQIETFRKRHRVVAVDLRGHGQSDKPEQAYTMRGFADDLVWLCREVRIERPVVIGHSMGGVIALTLAREGAQVAVSDINLEKARETCKEIESLGKKAVAIGGSVADHLLEINPAGYHALGCPHRDFRSR
jgi:pimeloyl-ACP methyl ester carboxylesterase